MPHNKRKLEVDGKPVGAAAAQAHAPTHAQTDGQPENILPAVPSIE